MSARRILVTPAVVGVLTILCVIGSSEVIHNVIPADAIIAEGSLQRDMSNDPEVMDLLEVSAEEDHAEIRVKLNAERSVKSAVQQRLRDAKGLPSGTEVGNDIREPSKQLQLPKKELKKQEAVDLVLDGQWPVDQPSQWLRDQFADPRERLKSLKEKDGKMQAKEKSYKVGWTHSKRRQWLFTRWMEQRRQANEVSIKHWTKDQISILRARWSSWLSVKEVSRKTRTVVLRHAKEKQLRNEWEQTLLSMQKERIRRTALIPKGDAALWKAKANEQARGRLEAWSRQRAKKEKVKTEAFKLRLEKTWKKDIAYKIRMEQSGKVDVKLVTMQWKQWMAANITAEQSSQKHIAMFRSRMKEVEHRESATKAKSSLDSKRAALKLAKLKSELQHTEDMRQYKESASKATEHKKASNMEELKEKLQHTKQVDAQERQVKVKVQKKLEGELHHSNAVEASAKQDKETATKHAQALSSQLARQQAAAVSNKLSDQQHIAELAKKEVATKDQIIDKAARYEMQRDHTAKAPNDQDIKSSSADQELKSHATQTSVSNATKTPMKGSQQVKQQTQAKQPRQTAKQTAEKIGQQTAKQIVQQTSKQVHQAAKQMAATKFPAGVGGPLTLPAADASARNPTAQLEMTKSISSSKVAAEQEEQTLQAEKLYRKELHKANRTAHKVESRIERLQAKITAEHLAAGDHAERARVAQDAKAVEHVAERAKKEVKVKFSVAAAQKKVAWKDESIAEHTEELLKKETQKDQRIAEHTQEMVKKEKQGGKEKLLAKVAHTVRMYHRQMRSLKAGQTAAESAQQPKSQLQQLLKKQQKKIESLKKQLLKLTRLAKQSEKQATSEVSAKQKILAKSHSAQQHIDHMARGAVSVENQISLQKKQLEECLRRALLKLQSLQERSQKQVQSTPIKTPVHNKAIKNHLHSVERQWTAKDLEEAASCRDSLPKSKCRAYRVAHFCERKIYKGRHLISTLCRETCGRCLPSQSDPVGQFEVSDFEVHEYDPMFAAELDPDDDGNSPLKDSEKFVRDTLMHFTEEAKDNLAIDTAE